MNPDGQDNIREDLNDATRYRTFTNFATKSNLKYRIPVVIVGTDVNFYSILFNSQIFNLSPNGNGAITNDINSALPFNFNHNITTDSTWYNKRYPYYGIPKEKNFRPKCGDVKVDIYLRSVGNNATATDIIVEIKIPKNTYVVGGFTVIDYSIFPREEYSSSLRIEKID
ncbi:Hypothetical protein ORPV_820 [Orpheovirus IHUMI-LCC2]|uniref:Uncharacterized protein n=1 Tax=Orpheovirus IHUMI-LCC2 TaxID=2023057 RepID=A0A2I2L5B8_9VIRU|nr:Hypothetical protein ORPV_820 [Orpheovirus IHUMI-LCC2]SNW62724.1 Hypothetical protein ORPV_820 [Orpheovirus IHUMI-LCC2]